MSQKYYLIAASLSLGFVENDGQAIMANTFDIL